MIKYFCFLIFSFFLSCKNHDCPAPIKNNGTTSNILASTAVGEVKRIDFKNGIRTKDAFISTFYTGVNYGADYKNYCTAWTYSTIEAEGFFLLKFDFSNISSTSKIISARLSLFTDTSNVFVGSPLPNKSHYGVDLRLKIKNLSTDWDELSVNYNNKPQVVENDFIIVESPLSLTASVIDIDVTSLVQKQLNLGIYGFEIRLNAPTLYKRIAFYSSNSPVVNQRPKLEVVYQ
jgi:hypothetical protein